MKAQKYTFKNGATLYYSRANINKATRFMVGINTGAMFDGDKPGISHFFEHMLFKGTEKRSVKQLKTDMRTIVPGLNAFTSSKEVLIDYYDSNRVLDKSFDFISDMLFHSTFPQEEINREFKVIEQEYFRSLDNYNRIAARLNSNFAWNYKYKIDALGDMDVLKTLKTQDFIDYRNKFLVPKNFVFYAVSSIPFTKFKKMVDKHFISQLPQSDIEHPKKELVFNGKSAITIEKKDTQKCILCISKPVLYPRSLKDMCITSYLLQIINGLGGRLLNKIREEESLVYAANCSKTSDANDGYFSLYAHISKDNMKKCIDLYAEVIEDLIVNGVSQKEIDDIKRKESLVEDKEIISHSAIINKLIFDYSSFERYITKKEWNNIRKSIGKREVDNMIRKIFDTNIVWAVVVGNATEDDLYNVKELKKKFDFRKLIKKVRDKDCVTDG